MTRGGEAELRQEGSGGTTSSPLEPFVTLLDLDQGLLTPEREVVTRTFGEMKSMYLESDSEHSEDALVYRVYLSPVPARNSEIQCSTTILEPGMVGSEYFMTKGHFHQVRDRSEVYIGLGGEGRLLLATEDGEYRVHEIRRGTVHYIPGWWAHRTINVGSDPLVFFAAYVGDAGHDYGTIEEQGFPVLVVHGDEGLRIVPNPRYDGGQGPLGGEGGPE
jgi:glucose-6-phosphate isomerase, archaeal